MTQATTSKPDPRLARFVKELNQLDRGQLAKLRRGLGGQESEVYWLEGLYARTGYGEAKLYQKNALQLVAGLFALKPGAREEEQAEADEQAKQETTDEEPKKRGPNIGKLMGQLYLLQDQRPSTEQRFLALLDCDRDGLGYHMRQVVMLLESEKIRPDWERLTEDLLLWTDKTRRIWARDFYQEISRNRKENAEAE